MNRVLFVDNDTMTLQTLKNGLIDEPYLKFFATSGEEALKVMERNTISVLVTAMKMQGMTGLNLLKAVKDKYPDLVKIVLSGYVYLPQVLVTVNQGDIFRFITKPFNLEDELKQTLREAVDSYNFWVGRREIHEILEKENQTFGNLLKTFDNQVKQLKFEITIIQGLNVLWQQQEALIMEQCDPELVSKEVFLRDMTHANDVITAAFNLIPTRIKLFSANQMIKEVLGVVADKKYLKQVDYGIKGNAEALMTGRYALIVFLINSIMEWAFMDDGDTKVSLVVSGAVQEGSIMLLTVLMEASEKSHTTGIAEKSVMVWLNGLAVRFGIEMTTRSTGGQRTIILSTLCAPNGSDQIDDEGVTEGEHSPFDGFKIDQTR